jgi:molybdate transport system substrate-binding protein
MATRRNLVLGLTAALVGLAMIFAAPSPPLGAQEKLTIFAAASLKNALDDVNAAWQADGGEPATISYAASSTLAKQIEQGGPADIFISADLDWMKYLSDKSLTKKDTEVQLLGNRIVLIGPKDSTVSVKIAPGFPLAELLGDGKLAMADVKSVPAGKYGKAALEALGVWASVEGKVAQSENVRAALKLVSSGEAPLGIVYQTDAAADPNVKVLDMFPENTHPPIVYPAAVIASSRNPGAGKFVKYLQSAKAKALFEKQGFTILVPKVTN